MSETTSPPPALLLPEPTPTFVPPRDELSLSQSDSVLRTLEAADFGHRRRRRLLPALLFIITCFTTFCAGAYRWEPDLLTFDRSALQTITEHWQDGLTFMLAVMGVLLAHEMGHFLMTVRYGIRSSYPLFIPLPVMMTGTMGAVIVMEGASANRKQLFDIGIAGPLAGLVLIVPLVILGVQTAVPETYSPENGHYGYSLLVKLLIPIFHPEMGPDQVLAPNALYMAAWVGMLVTGLNMLPISQLDGGHVSHALLGTYSRWLSRAVLIGAMAFIVVEQQHNWILMLVLVVFMGIHHPPTADDKIRIGPARWLLGLASLAIPVLCFIPYPFYID